MPILELHREIELDMCRSYGLLYEWVKGIDAVEAAERDLLSWEETAELTLLAEERMKKKGFFVCDRKPNHLIVRPKKTGKLAKGRDGNLLYAMVDFELLQRTREREETIRLKKQEQYLERFRNRFAPSVQVEMTHVTHVHIMGVDYVYGKTESTGGRLWVVGRDPGLFDYFLPERWEVMPRMKVSAIREIYQTVTKDDLNILWSVSTVGIEPDADPLLEQGRKILAFGYNSPFEEVDLALHLRKRGISTLRPLAIYMPEHRRELSPSMFHENRYINHRTFLNQDGSPLLRQDRSYITIWDAWNRLEPKTDGEDEDFFERMTALRAYCKRIISKADYVELMRTVRVRLKKVEVEDLSFRGTHILVSLNNRGRLIRDARGSPKVKLCSFDLLKRL